MHIKGRLREAFERGASLDVSGDPESERKVPAQFIVSLLSSNVRAGTCYRSRLDLTGATIVGELDFSHAELRCPVILHTCTFTSPFRMREARIPSLALHGCSIPEFDGHHLKVAGDLDLSEVHDCTNLNLTGASVANDVHLSGAEIYHEHHTVLDARNIMIKGNLDCSNLKIKGMVLLEGAHIEGAVLFEGASIEGDGPSDGDKALNADGMVVGYRLSANEMTVLGQASFEDFRCPGSVEFTGAHFTRSNVHATALSLDRSKIEGSIYCDDEFDTRGVLHAIGMEIGGSLYLCGASLDEPCENALILDRSVIKGNLDASKNSKAFMAHGTICLNGVDIDGSAYFNGAGIHVDRGYALELNDAKIGSSVRLCDEFAATGTVSMVGSQIGGILKLETKNISSHTPDMAAVDLARASVSTLRIYGAPEQGALDLTGAHASRVIDNPKDYLDSKGKLILNGLRYDSIHINGVRREDRIDWLQEGTRRIRKSEGGYMLRDRGSVSQPWQELAAAYRELGANRTARIILLNREREKNRGLHWQRKGYQKIWNYMQDLLMGYGYVLWRAVLVVFSLLIFGTIYFTINPPARSFNWFNALTYTVDLLLPTGLGGKTAWHPGGIGAVIAVALAVAGWLLTIAAIAGINRSVRS